MRRRIGIRNTSRSGIDYAVNACVAFMILASSSALAESDQESYRTQYDNVLKNCSDVAKSYQDRTSISQGAQFTIAAIGIVAGSIVGPTLAAGNGAKSTIAAFSGISGAVNGAQAAWAKDGLDSGSRSDAYDVFGTKVAELLRSVPYKLPDGAGKESAWNSLKALQWYCTGQQPIPGRVAPSPSTAGAANLQASQQDLSMAAALFAEANRAAPEDKNKLLSQAMQVLANANASVVAAQTNAAALENKIKELQEQVAKVKQKPEDAAKPANPTTSSDPSPDTTPNAPASGATVPAPAIEGR